MSESENIRTGSEFLPLVEGVKYSEPSTRSLIEINAMKRPDKQQTELGRKPVSAGLLDKQLKDKSKGVSVEKMNETIKENAPDFRNAPSRK